MCLLSCLEPFGFESSGAANIGMRPLEHLQREFESVKQLGIHALTGRRRHLAMLNLDSRAHAGRRSQRPELGDFALSAPTWAAPSAARLPTRRVFARLPAFVMTDLKCDATRL